MHYSRCRGLRGDRRRPNAALIGGMSSPSDPYGPGPRVGAMFPSGELCESCRADAPGTPETTREEWGRDDQGRLHDPAPGIPAVVWRRANGSVAAIAHYHEGVLDDDVDGSPAVVEWYADGSLARAEHHIWWWGRCDPDDGSPAVTWWHREGGIWREEHQEGGLLHSSTRGVPAVVWLRADSSIIDVEHWEEEVRQ